MVTATLGAPVNTRLASFAARIDARVRRSLVSPEVARALGLEILPAPAHLARNGILVVVPAAVVLASVDGCLLEPIVVGIADGLEALVVLGADWIALRG